MNSAMFAAMRLAPCTSALTMHHPDIRAAGCSVRALLNTQSAMRPPGTTAGMCFRALMTQQQAHTSAHVAGGEPAMEGVPHVLQALSAGTQHPRQELADPPLHLCRTTEATAEDLASLPWLCCMGCSWGLPCCWSSTARHLLLIVRACLCACSDMSHD